MSEISVEGVKKMLEIEAGRRFVVNATNSHQELVDALNGMIDRFRNRALDVEDMRILGIARVAVANVKRRTQ